jgi:hypothetical protein
MVFDAQWETALKQASFHPIDFERAESKPDWLMMRGLVQAVSPEGEEVGWRA